MNSGAPDPASSFSLPVPDVLGDDYESLTFPLPADEEGELVATVVRRRHPGATRAALYVHGFTDYFHQTSLADFHLARGESFYAIDLHKYGRSLRPHQTPYRMADVSEYYPELEAAADLIAADGHDDLVVSAHSTGGLITALWLHDRRATPSPPGGPTITALVLNSPFLALPANWLVRTLAGPSVTLLAQRRPLAVLPTGGLGLYGPSIHATEYGEWTFDLTWKPVAGGPVRAEWYAAASRAIGRVAAGLDVGTPVLTLLSDKAVRATKWTEEAFTGDTVLDPDALAQACVRLGAHVTCVRIVDGMHDLLLSRAPARERTLTEMGRWLDAYARTDSPTPHSPATR
ncbi:alpha/beta hydrolase [Nakamurella flava]|uniref:alpha/beta hydrolase n=1 Tax=Nakamurella flava TaxID=2576308 RepID=UPI00140E51FA|nr:alpha/beta hydrolase [Nakamurella flava]